MEKKTELKYCELNLWSGTKLNEIFFCKIVLIFKINNEKTDICLYLHSKFVTYTVVFNFYICNLKMIWNINLLIVNIAYHVNSKLILSVCFNMYICIIFKFLCEYFYFSNTIAIKLIKYYIFSCMCFLSRLFILMENLFHEICSISITKVMELILYVLYSREILFDIITCLVLDDFKRSNISLNRKYTYIN